MGTHKVNFVKNNNNWFADFTETSLTPNINGVNQQHLRHLVGGWDAWLEIVSEGSDNFWMTVSNSPFTNCSEIKRLNKTNTKEIYNGCGLCIIFESYRGVTYNKEFWACSNGFEFVFGNVPSSWFFIKND